jgi:DMSO/TMAO reductase YedYZ molybdopterin-dependent catalytic subunit
MKSKNQMLWVGVLVVIALILSGCGAPAVSTAQVVTLTPTIGEPGAGGLLSTVEVSPGQCVLEPVVVPTRPDVIPGYAQLDTTTDMHITGVAQDIDITTYRLKVTGLVDHPLELTYDEIRCMEKISAKVDLVCPGYFHDTPTFAGVPLKTILDMAGIQAGATEIELFGADNYTSFVSVLNAQNEDNFLAYEWEGQPLPILHGFPLRAVFPGEYGSHWVKWLLEIKVR